MIKVKALLILLLTMYIGLNAWAQRITEIGLTGGFARYYPDLQEKLGSLNDQMDPGLGFTAGIFLEDHWTPRIHQVVEVNYINLTSDVLLENNSHTGGGYGGTNQRFSKDYHNALFNYIAVSGGLKFFLNKKLFAYPGLEMARILTDEVDLNKTTYHLKLGAGLNFRKFDVIAEYNYGLNFQRRFYNIDPPLLATHINKYLQLKVQVPVFNWK